MPIDDADAKAVQPVAIAGDSKYPELSRRLVSQMRSHRSKQQFEERGFQWLAGSESIEGSDASDETASTDSRQADSLVIPDAAHYRPPVERGAAVNEESDSPPARGNP